MIRHGVIRSATGLSGGVAALNRGTSIINHSALNSTHLPLTFPSLLQLSFLRAKCSISGKILNANGTGGFDLTFLGTSSQGGARRYPSCLALRLRGQGSSQVWLFDAGEGATAQLQRSNMRIGLVRNIFITHMHGDHLFGLPGLVMCILGRRDEASHRMTSSPQHHVNSSTSSPFPSTFSHEQLSPDVQPNARTQTQQHLQSHNASSVPDDGALHIYGPQGVRSFLRTALGVASFRVPSSPALYIHELVWPYGCGPSGQRNRHRRARPYWHRNVRRLPFEGEGRDIEPERSADGEWTYRLMESATGVPDLMLNGEQQPHNDERAAEKEIIRERNPASVVAAPVLHTIPTFAYSVCENVSSRRFDKGKLGELGIPKDGRDEVRRLFSKWLSGERGFWKGQEIDVSEVLQNGRCPRRLCVIGDTYDATPAAHIARNVDVLVHEATNVAAQTDLARKRGHSSTIGATGFAKKVDAKRLILNHTSVAYSDRKMRSLENEGRAMFGSNKVFVARDLSVFSVPTTEEDGEDFVFRRFIGFADSIEYRNQGQSGSLQHGSHALPQSPTTIGQQSQTLALTNNPFSSDFDVHDDEEDEEDEEGRVHGEDDKPDGDIDEDEGDDEDDQDGENLGDEEDVDDEDDVDADEDEDEDDEQGKHGSRWRSSSEMVGNGMHKGESKSVGTAGSITGRHSILRRALAARHGLR